jgi:hypothetical protein
MSLAIFDRRDLVLRARALTAAVGGSFLLFLTVRNFARWEGEPNRRAIPKRTSRRSIAAGGSAIPKTPEQTQGACSPRIIQSR